MPGPTSSLPPTYVAPSPEYARADDGLSAMALRYSSRARATLSGGAPAFRRMLVSI